MNIKIFCPLWGNEKIAIKSYLEKIKMAGFDGIETWMPADDSIKKDLFIHAAKQELLIIAHQHEAKGNTFAEFKTSFLQQLQRCAEANPVMINSHTGKDYFPFEDNRALLDIAADFSAKTGIEIAHETHRGRLGYSPSSFQQYKDARKDLTITADFSHWVCVTESFLENFTHNLQAAIQSTTHIHARIGYEEGPQVPDPRAPEWQYASAHFLEWWDQIVAARQAAGHSLCTFTTEFGPPPYMPVLPYSGKPVADQFELNCYMKDLLRKRYVV